MIPHIIHRIYLEEPMPPVFADFGREWKDMHPDWEVVDWQDPDRLPPLRNRDLYDRAPTIIPGDWRRFRADIVRLELVWAFGGVYVDTDTTPRQPLDDLDDLTCFVARSPKTRRGFHAITNAVIGAAPYHPFIGEAIRTLPAAVAKHAGEPLAVVAGPWHLQRVYEAGRWPDVTVFPFAFYRDRVDHRWNSGLRRRGRGLA